MAQVTVYLEEDVESKMIEAAKLLGLAKSKWIAKLTQDKVANVWRKAIVDIAGTWDDFPRLKGNRSHAADDIERELI